MSDWAEYAIHNPASVSFARPVDISANLNEAVTWATLKD